MVEIPRNGRTLCKGDPLLNALIAQQNEYRARGEPYPKRNVDNIPDVPHVWRGHVPFDAMTLEQLVPTAEAKRRPIALPDHFVLDGERRLPGETRVQYTKYLAFRDLGPERSLNRLAKSLGARAYNRNGDAFTNGHMSATAHRFRWHERAAAYDSGREVEARRTVQQLEQDQMREHIERRQTYLDNEYAIIEQSVKRIQQMLAFPVDEQEIVTERDKETGRPIAITIIRPVRWNLASLSSYIGELQKLARLHFGMSTSNASQKIKATVSDATNRQERPMSVEDREAHEFAAARAETAYFDALEEFKQSKTGEPLVATITEPSRLALVRNG